MTWRFLRFRGSSRCLEFFHAFPGTCCERSGQSAPKLTRSDRHTSDLFLRFQMM